MSTLALVLLILAAAGLYVTHARFWPYARCRSCRGRKKGLGSAKWAYRHCSACGGSGERVRLVARLWPRWRQEAAKRKEET